MNQIKTLLPYIANGPILPHTVFLNTTELDLVALISNHSEQKRKEVIVSRGLTSVARAKALDMANRDYVGHITPEGIGPNQMVRDAGINLPEWYGDKLDSNNIESLAWAGSGDVVKVWDGWLQSESHRIHLLGLEGMFAAQTHVGMGYAYVEESKYQHYYCFLSIPHMTTTEAQ